MNIKYLGSIAGMFDICNWTFKEEGDYSTLYCGTYESDPGEEDFSRFVNM